jgi:hypothetical protein
MSNRPLAEEDFFLRKHPYIPAVGAISLLFSWYRRHFTHDYIGQGVKPTTHYQPAKAKGQNPTVLCDHYQHIFSWSGVQ